MNILRTSVFQGKPAIDGKEWSIPEIMGFLPFGLISFNGQNSEGVLPLTKRLIYNPALII